MAQRKSRRKKRKTKDIIGIQKGPPALQLPNGKVNVYKKDDGAPPAILKDVDMLKQQNEEYGMRFILGAGYDLDVDGIEEEDKSNEQDQAQAPHEPEVQDHGAQAPAQAPAGEQGAAGEQAEAEVPAEVPVEVPAEEPAAAEE